mgnify:CR=1 FL=1
MDRLDRKILSVLQHNARASLQDIGAAVGLSPSPCWARIRKMEEAGVIEGYTVRLNPQALGLANSVLDGLYKLLAEVIVDPEHPIRGKIEENGRGMLSFYSSVTGCVTLCDSLHRPPAGPGLACFRPSSVRLVPYDHSLAGADRIVMHGRIARSEFRGGYVRYGVDVADQTIVCDLPRRTGTLAMPVGSEVQLAVDVSQIRFIQAG